MVLLLILFPAFFALAAFLVTSDKLRRLMLVGAAFVELCLVASCWFFPPPDMFGGVLGLDPLGLLVLSITSLLFLAASVYGVNYLHVEGEHDLKRDFRQGFHFSNAPETVFCACLLAFLSTSALVACSQHMGLIWVGIEATTLVTAPAIYFHRHRRSLEATWKYLIICSVGIALALLGNILLNVSLLGMEGQGNFLLSYFADMQPAVHPYWFQAAFVCIFIGYATKMGIAPMHTWLPDAHSEAPSMVSALLSGALLNGSFLGLLRLRQVTLNVGMQELCNEVFILFGLVSMALAAMFIVGQRDYKRMLAYSSVEHMGILLLGIGLGHTAGGGALLHMTGHSMIKAALFLLAGNILACYHSTSMADVKGLHKALPRTSGFWLLGFLAITGTPPFVTFSSELRILLGAVRNGNFFIAALYLIFLGIIFVAMLTALIKMFAGDPPMTPAQARGKRESRLRLLPSAFLLALALVMGIWTPGPVLDMIDKGLRLLF